MRLLRRHDIHKNSQEVYPFEIQTHTAVVERDVVLNEGFAVSGGKLPENGLV